MIQTHFYVDSNGILKDDVTRSLKKDIEDVDYSDPREVEELRSSILNYLGGLSDICVETGHFEQGEQAQELMEKIENEKEDIEMIKQDLDELEYSLLRVSN